MSGIVRIGNAYGFWGDRPSAAAQMLAVEPDLDYLTLDFLAEVSMSVLAGQKLCDADAGYPRDFLEIVRSIAPYWSGGGRCRMIANGGGLNPLACARACADLLRQAACEHIRIAVVSGDDLLTWIKAAERDDPQRRLLQNLDTGQGIESVAERLVTANAYLGAEPVVQALRAGADLVITGRVADPSMTVAACVNHFDWPADDWDRIAGATVAGHLIECGTQVTGGISTDWSKIPAITQIGFPIVEVADNGSCVVTKPPGTGGRVDELTVKEQLVYEIGDPRRYLSPDATVSFLSLDVRRRFSDRVEVRGAKGQRHPDTLKVSATYRDGFRAAGQLTVVGQNAVSKARRAADAILTQLSQAGATFRNTVVECIGNGACLPGRGAKMSDPALFETVLRIAVADDSRDAVERFSRELMSLVTAGPPGTTGYAEGRPRVHPMFGFWPCLVERRNVQPQIGFLNQPAAGGAAAVVSSAAVVTHAQRVCLDESQLEEGSSPKILSDIACARSGDKGQHANIGVIARQPEWYDSIRSLLTPEHVATFLNLPDDNPIERFELPNLHAINFIMRGILSNPLRLDAQGKTLGQLLLQMPLLATTCDGNKHA